MMMQEQTQAVSYDTIREFKIERDKAIVELRMLTYQKQGRLVVRKKENRDRVQELMARARVYAALARPDFGYPKPPCQTAHPEYNYNQPDERKRLVNFHAALVRQGAPEVVLNRISAQITRLEKNAGIVVNNRVVIVDKK